MTAATVPVDELTVLKAEVDAMGGSDHAPTRLGQIAVGQAIEAGLEGNAAIGAILVDEQGAVMRADHNRMFTPYFRSDFHAEMVLLTRHEDEHRDSDLLGCTLVSSLEPCEMCMIRIINSGVSNVRWVADDIGKGAITGPNRLADHWQALADAQDFRKLECPDRLAEIGLEVFVLCAGRITEKLRTRRSYAEADHDRGRP